MIEDLLLPETDGAVALQLAATVLVGPLAVAALVRHGQRDLAWLVAGLVAIGLAFAGFRSLH